MSYRRVSKLFRAYGLYNNKIERRLGVVMLKFQSSFELMGYITLTRRKENLKFYRFQSSFELMGYIT